MVGNALGDDIALVRSLGLQGIMNLGFKLSTKLSHGLQKKVNELLQNIGIFKNIVRRSIASEIFYRTEIT